MTKQYFHVIGAGKVGQSLAILLNQSPFWQLDQVYSRSQTSCQYLLQQTPAREICTNLHTLPPAKLVLITTPDSQIVQTVEKLCHLTWLSTEKPLILHCSGALSHQVLQPLATQGAHIATLHPVFAFANAQLAVTNLAGHFAAIDANNEISQQLTKYIADILGLQAFYISAEQKALYHAALSASANFLVALSDLTQSWLHHAGVDKKSAQQLVGSLMQQNIDNLLTLDPKQALTGPIARGDTVTVEKHWQALPDTLSQTCYQALAQATLQTALPQLTEEQQHAMQKTLQHLP